jgi:hypothetical protein
VEATNEGFVIWYDDVEIMNYQFALTSLSNICFEEIQSTIMKTGEKITVENFPLIDPKDFKKCIWKIKKNKAPSETDDIVVKWTKGSGSSKVFLFQFLMKPGKIQLTSVNKPTVFIDFPSGDPPYEWIIQATSKGFRIIYNTVEAYFFKRLINLSSFDSDSTKVPYTTGSNGGMSIEQLDKIPLIDIPCSWSVDLTNIDVSLLTVNDSIVWKSNTDKKMLSMYISNDQLYIDSDKVMNVTNNNNKSNIIIIYVDESNIKTYIISNGINKLIQTKTLSLSWNDFNYVQPNGKIKITKDKKVFDPTIKK